MKIVLPALLLLAVFALVGAPFALAQDPEDVPAPPEKPYSDEQMQKLQELMPQAQNALRNKEYEAAAKAFEAVLVVIDAKGPLAQNAAYNLACCYGLLKDRDKTLDWLEKAVDYGFRDANHIKLDGDLDVAKSSPRFKTILGKLTWNDVVDVHVPDGVDPNIPLPLLVALHVRGADEKHVTEYLKALADEKKVMIVAPRAPFVDPDRPSGYAWKLDSSDDAPAMKKIAMSLEAAAKAHPFDPQKVTILGLGSRGGYMAYLMGLRQPERFQRIVALAGWFNKYLFPDFYEKAKPLNKGIWIFHGAAMKNVETAKQAEESLRKGGFTVVLELYEGDRRPSAEQLAAAGAALVW